MDDGLKQRVVGAVVLVALMVIFLPMFFSEEPKKPAEILIEMPEKPPVPETRAGTPTRPSEPMAEQEAMQAKQTDEISQQQDRAATQAEQAVLQQAQATKQAEELAQQQARQAESAALQQANAAKEAAKLANEAAQQKARIAKLAAEEAAQQEAWLEDEALSTKKLDDNNLPVSWTLQIASFKELSNAEMLRDKLRASGYKSYIKYRPDLQPVMIRVYVGPASERAAIEKIRDNINKQHQLKGVVVRFLP